MEGIMKLEDLEVYQLAMRIGEIAWTITTEWDRHARRTMGTQLVRAGDSIAANISEGFGRYHYAENRNFCYYARGSLYETKTWLTKAHQRGYLDHSDHQMLQRLITTTGVKLNNYIRSIGSTKA
ncbi:MAG: four helix bundle protein [Bacteroidetes bacterium]|jgi:four helix bundle protein|nr:four helix bundle protein [Bacteroidota bacterium]